MRHERELEVSLRPKAIQEEYRLTGLTTENAKRRSGKKYADWSGSRLNQLRAGVRGDRGRHVRADVAAEWHGDGHS